MKIINMNTKKLILAGLVLKSTMGLITLLFFSSYLTDKTGSKCSLVQKDSNQTLESNSFYKLYDSLINDIYNSSAQQGLISKETLLTTLKYMIEEREAHDPELVNFVQTLIQPPSKKKINLRKNKADDDYSQYGQSRYIDEQLDMKNYGFFVEAGGYDGEQYSNSLYFELKRNWTGVLIEPVPSLYTAILSKNRNAYALNACVGGDKPLVAKFRIFDAMSGREKEMSKEHMSAIEAKARTENVKTETLYVPCFSLDTILRALDRKQVDYLSLDVEDGEFDVLKSVKFGEVDVRAISIEYNKAEVVKKLAITHYLTNNNYVLSKTGEYDLFFIKK
jgi:FkbM family methyltransferase